MTGAVADLTDKEKEALRLLLSGHDAKTSAAALQLSVHTINDRLRNARRKLGVSSSREAARILGDTEGGAPQNHAHTDFGMADTPQEMEFADLNETRPTSGSRTVWLAGGMLIMSLIMATIVVGALYIDNTPVTENVPETEENMTETEQVSPEDQATVRKAEGFLQLVDTGDWEASWEFAGSTFQAELTAAEWAAAIEPVRQPLGAVQSRELAGVELAESLPGAPEGDYTVLQYQTDFDGREADTMETVVMIRAGDGWDIVGYFVR